MSPCEVTRELLLDLPVARFGEIEHLGSCARCAVLADRLREAEAAIGDRVDGFAGGGDVDAALALALGEAPPNPYFRRIPLMLVGLAALVLAALAFHPHQGGPPRVVTPPTLPEPASTVPVGPQDPAPIPVPLPTRTAPRVTTPEPTPPTPSTDPDPDPTPFAPEAQPDEDPASPAAMADAWSRGDRVTWERYARRSLETDPDGTVAYELAMVLSSRLPDQADDLVHYAEIALAAVGSMPERDRDDRAYLLYKLVADARLSELHQAVARRASADAVAAARAKAADAGGWWLAFATAHHQALATPRRVCDAVGGCTTSVPPPDP